MMIICEGLVVFTLKYNQFFLGYIVNIFGKGILRGLVQVHSNFRVQTDFKLGF